MAPTQPLTVKRRQSCCNSCRMDGGCRGCVAITRAHGRAEGSGDAGVTLPDVLIITFPEQETDLCLPREEGALSVVSAGLLAVLGAGAPRQCLHLVTHLQTDGRVNSRTTFLGQIVKYAA